MRNIRGNNYPSYLTWKNELVGREYLSLLLSRAGMKSAVGRWLRDPLCVVAAAQDSGGQGAAASRFPTPESGGSPKQLSCWWSWKVDGGASDCCFVLSAVAEGGKAVSREHGRLLSSVDGAKEGAMCKSSSTY